MPNPTYHQDAALGLLYNYRCGKLGVQRLLGVSIDGNCIRIFDLFATRALEKKLYV